MELNDIYFKNIFFCLFLTILWPCNAVFNIRKIRLFVHPIDENTCQQKNILYVIEQAVREAWAEEEQ